MIDMKLANRIMSSRLGEECPKLAAACITAIDNGVSPALFHTLYEHQFGCLADEDSAGKRMAEQFDQFMQMHCPESVGAAASEDAFKSAKAEAADLLSIPGR